MEAQDAADNIREAAEKRELASDERKIKQEEAAERFRRRAAVIIGILAALLAITALGADQARETVTNANIRADDTYNFYQAKNIRQTSYQLAAGDLQALVQINPTLPAAARASIQARLAGYKKNGRALRGRPQRGRPR